MKYIDMSNDIASSMDSILKDPAYKSMFSSSSVLEKLAFTRVADENLPTELEVELSETLTEQALSQPLEATAASPKADCIACGKTRSNWTDAVGVCKCASQGCNPMIGCKEGCSCGCKSKQAGAVMDTLIKSAFDSLMKASSELEEAGLETLAADTLVLMTNLVVEAKKKDKKLSKEDKAKAKAKADAAKEKEKADREKAKIRAEKDKNAAKDKAMKEKARAEKEKARAKAEAEKAKSKK